jgi:2-iminobutanoate/2-iminopropanoate deaminase
MMAAPGGSDSTLDFDFADIRAPATGERELFDGLIASAASAERKGLMTMREVVESGRVPRIGPYSQVVRVGDLVFTAGQPGINPETGEVAGADFEAQARQAFANLRAVLEDAGSGMEHVARVTCFVTQADAFPTLNKLFSEYFPSSPPVRSTPVVALPRGLLFSIDAIGVVRR